MKKQSIRQKAGRANGASRACGKCPFLFKDMEICKVCRESFKEGYIKGYRQAKKELSNQ